MDLYLRGRVGSVLVSAADGCGSVPHGRGRNQDDNSYTERQREMHFDHDFRTTIETTRLGRVCDTCVEVAVQFDRGQAARTLSSVTRGSV